jgi:peptidoglycan hydrolase-like protein with peptidoglycan-binding domain
VKKRFVFAVAVGLAIIGSVSADDNVREVQTKLADEGCYFGEIDGAYSTDFSVALSRYQIRNGLPITGQLDAETSKALGAKPAVGPSTAATEQSSETWRGLRKRERRTSKKRRETSSPTDNETPPTGTETPIQTTPWKREPRQRLLGPSRRRRQQRERQAETMEPASSTVAKARTSPVNTEPASAQPATGLADEFSAERLRDYVAAYVLGRTR